MSTPVIPDRAAGAVVTRTQRLTRSGFAQVHPADQPRTSRTYAAASGLFAVTVRISAVNPDFVHAELGVYSHEDKRLQWRPFGADLASPDAVITEAVHLMRVVRTDAPARY